MIIKRENLWEHPSPDYLCVSVGSTIWSSKLALGPTGFAKQVKYRYPQIEFYFAGAIKNVSRKVSDNHVYSNYYIVELRRNGQNFIIFQVKKHYQDDVDMEIIKESAIRLNKLATERQNKSFYLSCPETSEANQNKILEMLNFLPDNVAVFVFRGK